ncbi:MAG: hypothetical protein ACHQZQ_06875 [SAR324 cluster bacterium]
MKPEITAAIKPALWGAVGGAIIAIVIGFYWGGWTLSSTTQKDVKDAVVRSEAAICFARFVAQPKHEDALAKFNKIDTWSRSDFIVKGGWDKMPGQAAASPDVAQACTDLLNGIPKN